MPFRRLWLARATSMVGDRLATITILSLVVVQGHGPGGVSLVLVADILPRLFGPLLGLLGDRVDPRRLMIVCDLTQVAVFTAMTIVATSLPALVIGVSLAALVTTTYRSAMAALIPQLISPERLVAANSFLAAANNMGLAVGPLAGGLLASTIGPRHGLWVNALTFLLSAGLLASMPRVPSTRDHASARRVGDPLRHGYHEIAQRRLLRALTLGCFAFLLFACLENSAVVFLTQNVLDGGPAGYGLLVSVYGVGMIAAPLAVGALYRRARDRHLLYAGEASYGVATIATGLAPSLPLAAAGAFAAGGGNGLESTAIETLIQRHSPPAILGVVYGTVYSVMALGSLISFALGGFIVTWLGARGTYILSGGGVLLVLLALVLTLRLPAQKSIAIGP